MVLDRWTECEFAFQVVSDPARWVRAWREARAAVAVLRAASEAAGCADVFPELRPEISDDGKPLVYLGAADPDAVLRFIALLRGRVPDDGGPPRGQVVA
jgi:hypothetical protein